MTLKIEVLSTQTEKKSGTNGRGPWEIIEQTAYLFKDANDKYPQEIVVPLEKGATPYNPGLYTLDDKSFYVGQYRQLNMRPKLVPLVAAAAPASRQAS